MKYLLNMVALCSFSFTFASEQDVPKCSAFRYMFGAPKVSLENLKSAVESRDYCKTRAILLANQSMALERVLSMFTTRINAKNLDFRKLGDTEALESEATKFIKAGGVLSQDKILSCNACLANNPGSILRNLLVGASPAQQMSQELVLGARSIEVRPMLGEVAWQFGNLVGYNSFMLGHPSLTEEDRCRAMLDFFELSGCSAHEINRNLHTFAIAIGAKVGFETHAKAYGKSTSCDVLGYFRDKKKLKEAFDAKKLEDSLELELAETHRSFTQVPDESVKSAESK